MITLSEIKSYIGIYDNSKNEFLLNLINQSLKEFETMTNRNYLYNSAITEYIDCNEFSDRVYLKTNPISSITSIQYYEALTETYTDLISDSGDTIANSIEIRDDYIYIRKGYTIFEQDLKIVYVAGYKYQKSAGTITALNGNTSLTGTSTAFTTEAMAGDIMILDNELLKVSSITSNTVIVTTSKIQYNHANSIVYFTNFPEDIRQAVKDICKMKYEQTQLQFVPVNDNKEIKPIPEMPYNVTSIIDYYRKVNV